MWRQKLAVEPAAKSRDLLSYSGWESESWRNWTRKRKTKRSSVLAWLCSPGSWLGKRISVQERKVIDSSSFLSHPFPHILIHILISLLGLIVSSLLKTHTHLSLSNSFYTCLYFTMCTFYAFLVSDYSITQKLTLPSCVAFISTMETIRINEYAVFWSTVILTPPTWGSFSLLCNSTSLF